MGESFLYHRHDAGTENPPASIKETGGLNLRDVRSVCFVWSQTEVRSAITLNTGNGVRSPFEGASQSAAIPPSNGGEEAARRIVLAPIDAGVGGAGLV